MGRRSESAGCVGEEKKKSVDKKTGVEMMGGYMGEWLKQEYIDAWINRWMSG